MYIIKFSHSGSKPTTDFNLLPPTITTIENMYQASKISEIPQDRISKR